MTAGARRARPTHDRWVLRVEGGFDGTDPLPGPSDIVIAGDRIVSVLPAGGAAILGDERVVDLHPASAIPGLVNAHEHLVVTHHLTDVDQRARTAVFGPHWRNLLVAGYQMDFGVTTIQGLAGPLFGELSLRDRLLPKHGNAVPDYLTVGPITTHVGGYPPYVDGRSGRLLVVKAESDTAAEARSWVRYLAGHGVDAVKVATGDYGYGGARLPASMHHRADVLDATVDEAHRCGLRVFAHTYGADGFDAALRAGADVLAHLPVDPVPDRVLDEVVERDVVVIPTLFHMHCRVNARFPRDARHNGDDFDVDEWRAEFALMEGDEQWGARLWRELHRFDRPLGSSNSAYDDRPLDFELVAVSTATMRDTLRRLQARGAALAYGQDASHSLPYRELREMSRCGLSTVEVLTAATSGSARAVGREGDRGRLVAGCRADIVVYERSPLDELAALRALPLIVVRNGQIVRRRSDIDAGPGSSGVASRFSLDRAERQRFVAAYVASLGLGMVRGLRAPHRRGIIARSPSSDPAPESAPRVERWR